MLQGWLGTLRTCGIKHALPASPALLLFSGTLWYVLGSVTKQQTCHQTLHTCITSHHVCHHTACISSQRMYQQSAHVSAVSACISSQRMYQQSAHVSVVSACISSQRMYQQSAHVSAVSECISSQRIYMNYHSAYMCASVIMVNLVILAGFIIVLDTCDVQWHFQHIEQFAITKLVYSI